MTGCGRSIGPYDCCTIITGDSKELAPAIPNESVDLIVTDPPYNAGKDYGPLVDDALSEKDYLSWYGKVVAECYRVMGNGYLYVSCTTNHLWSLRPLWEGVGFSWQLMCLWWGPNYAGVGDAIVGQWRVLYEPIMMFLKGPRVAMLNEIQGCNSDAIMRYTRPQRSFGGELERVHPTQKPVDLYLNIIGRTPGGLVLDPFVGSGTSAIAAKKLGRHYLAFEIDPDVAERARERVRNTQPPLFVMQPEQAEMELP